MTDSIFILVAPRDINYVNRIMEGYEYLGMVSTLDRQEGLLIIRATADTRTQVLEILANLPIPVRLVQEHE